MYKHRLLLTLSLLLSAYAAPVLAESAGLCALPPSDNPGILQAQQRLCGWAAPTQGLNTTPSSSATAPTVTAPVARAEAEEAFEEESDTGSSTDETLTSVAPSALGDEDTASASTSGDSAPDAGTEGPQTGSAQGSASGSQHQAESQYTAGSVSLHSSEPVTVEGEEEFESFGPSVPVVDATPQLTPTPSPRPQEEETATPRDHTPAESEPSQPSTALPQPKTPSLAQILPPVSEARLASLKKRIADVSKDRSPSRAMKQEAKDELLDRALRINSAAKLTFDGTTRLQHQYLQALNSVSGVAGDHNQIMALVNGDDFLTLPQTQALRAYAALERIRILEQHSSDCSETPDQRGCADLNKIRLAAGLPALA